MGCWSVEEGEGGTVPERPRKEAWEHNPPPECVNEQSDNVCVYVCECTKGRASAHAKTISIALQAHKAKCTEIQANSDRDLKMNAHMQPHSLGDMQTPVKINTLPEKCTLSVHTDSTQRYTHTQKDNANAKSKCIQTRTEICTSNPPPRYMLTLCTSSNCFKGTRAILTGILVRV